MKRLAAGAVALLVLLSLTGCGSFFVRHDVSEKPLQEQLSHVATVVDVTSSVDDMFGHTVWVNVNKLVESDLQTVVRDADKLLAGRDVTFKITLRNYTLLTIVFPNQFSADELSHEVTYWLAMSSAEGAPLGMILEAGKQGRFRNIWNPAGDGAAVKWQALRAVPDPGPPDRDWFLDGFVAMTAMPTPEVVAFKDRLAAIPLGHGESVVVEYFVPGFVGVRYISPDAGLADPTASASWPRVQEIVTQLAALDLPQSNFVFVTDKFSRKLSSVHLGACSKVQSEGQAWPQLAAALTSSGINFPRGVSSGYCDDFEQ